MYFEYVTFYTIQRTRENKKRRITLNAFDAISKCNILIKMARLRFPGRPGQRIGKKYVKYVYDEVKLNLEPSPDAPSPIKFGLKLFYELFGSSDEEDEFEGFNPDDLLRAELHVTRKSVHRQKIEDAKEGDSIELSSSYLTDSDKISSDSDTSQSLRRQRGMRDIIRKSYAHMIKHGISKEDLHKSGIDALSEDSDNSIKRQKSDLSDKNKHDSSDSQAKSKDVTRSNVKDLIALETKRCKRALVERLLSKVRNNQVKNRCKRRRRLAHKVHRNFNKPFRYSCRKKYSRFPKKMTVTDMKQRCPKSFKDTLARTPVHSLRNNSKDVHPKPKRHSMGNKKFVLPLVSSRSSRKIIPRKKYGDVDSTTTQTPDKQVLDEESQLSVSSLSGSSETISAMDGGSSPDNTDFEEKPNESNSMKKVGLLDGPLVVEGKRPWKPSLKVQMKLSQMNCEYPFRLKRTTDESSGTGTSSGSFKDIIKPDMVSRYAEKMAQKPKEKPQKIMENVKKSPHPSKCELEKTDIENSQDDEKKPEDKLEKVAAKIEKLLKSQWEGRLKDSTVQPQSKALPKIEPPLTQWKPDRPQLSSNQRRTKSILRKARLQLKKRNLNLRARKNEKSAATESAVMAMENKPVPIPEVAEKVLGLPIVEPVDVPSKRAAPSTSAENDLPQVCVVCSFSEVYSHAQKLYDQIACESCNKFFESFANSPKQYFCTKDGKCNVTCTKDGTTRRASSSKCKACWLKTCMEKFTVSAFLRDQLIKYVPRLDAPPHNPLLKDEDLETSKEVSKEEGRAKGPRIKHVCRRAAVVLGLPRATFSDVETVEEPFKLSALPLDEKQKILETDAVPSEAKLGTSTNRSKQQVKKKARKDFKVKNRIHLDLLKKSSLLIHKKQKKRKLLMKKSLKHMHKHSIKKSLKVGKKNEMKKTLKFSYKSAVKSSMKSSPSKMAKHPTRPVKVRKVRCKQCEGCLAEDCGQCVYCLDKKKFGGPNLIKQACMFRRCLRPVLPASEKKALRPPHSENDDKGNPSGGHSSFGGGGPSGIGTSLTSSSSSPSSPDGSSCGSSCSSSSSSSSSGSSGSSSSSSSNGSGTSKSSRENNSTLPKNEVTDNVVNGPSVLSSTTEPFVFQEPLCDENASEVLLLSTTDCDRVVSDLFYQYDDVLLAKDDIQPLVTVSEFGHHSFNEVSELYDESPRLTELKNVSIPPHLMYGLPLYGNSSHSSEEIRKQVPRKVGRPRKQPERDDEIENWNNGPYDDNGGDDGKDKGDDGGDDDNDDDDDDDDKKHLILADYWEDYDLERISSQGFALISSQQIPLQCACYLCGSAGQEKLIFCVLCCEPYHTFCLNEDDVPSEENIENWCCKRCQSCAVCGVKNNLLKCKKCQNSYHPECLAPHYPTKPSRKKKIWVCHKCVKCKSCGATSMSTGSLPLWNFDSLLCQCCAKLTDKGNYCPVCHQCYEEDDYTSQMIQCQRCERWVHAKCDKISDEEYEILSYLPDDIVQYSCIDCTVEPTAVWKDAVKEHLTDGLKKVINALLNARCMRHLISGQDISNTKIPAYMMLNHLNSKSLEGSTRFLDKSSLIDDIEKNSEFEESQLEIETALGREKSVKEAVDDLLACVDATTPSSPSDELDEDDSDAHQLPKIMDDSSLKYTENIHPRINGSVYDFDENLPTLNSVNHCTPPKKTLKVRTFDLLTIKERLDKTKYDSIDALFSDVVQLIDSGNETGKRHYTYVAKTVFSKQLEKVFPWYRIPASKLWNSERRNIPSGMLPDAVVPPCEDHSYAQYLVREEISACMLSEDDELIPDNRMCVLCGYTGDDKPKRCGRLLYCGQDDWMHVNCALWSAEARQGQDGTLHNIYLAMTRGRLLRCEVCKQPGATVGCCVRGCSSNYHFYCARKDLANFLEDRKLFCNLHSDQVDARILHESEFYARERVHVHQSSIYPKWIKNSWKVPMEADKIHVLIGSLTINNFGYLSPLSDAKTVLIPINYQCTRKFWSTKNPRMRVNYTCRTIEVSPKKFLHSEITDRTIIHNSELVLSNRKIKAEVSTDSPLTVDTIVPELSDKIENLCDMPTSSLDTKSNCDSCSPKSVDSAVPHCSTTSGSQIEDSSSKGQDCTHMNDKMPTENNHKRRLTDEENVLCSIIKRVIKSQKKATQISNSQSCAPAICGHKRKLENSKSSYVNGYKSDVDKKHEDLEYENCCNLLINELSKFLNNRKQFSRDKCNDTNQEVDMNKNIVASSKLDSQETPMEISSKNNYKPTNPNSLSNANFQDGIKLMNLINEQGVTKEVADCVMQFCKEKRHHSIPKKLATLLKSVIPSHGITEMVLPVYNVESNESSIINESSGYSSNDDLQSSDFKRPHLISANLDERDNLPCASLESKLNNCNKNSTYNCFRNTNSTFNASNNEIKSANDQINHHNGNGYEKSDIKFKNGISLNVGPFKCGNCKRIYRTKESFEKHTMTCDFIIDSSSSEEESSSEENLKQLGEQNDTKQSEVDDSFTEKPQDKNDEKILETNTEVVKLNDNCMSTAQSTLNVTNKSENEILNTSQCATNGAYVMPSSNVVAQVPKNQVSSHGDTHVGTCRCPSRTVPKAILPKSVIPAPNVTSYNQVITETVAPVNMSAVPLNVGYPNNALCAQEPPRMMPIPCNTLILPKPEPVPQPTMIPIAPDGFMQPPMDVSAQLSYVGSITITNNEPMSFAINVPDQMNVFQQQNISFAQPPMVQQNPNIQLSGVNVQQISLQNSFHSPVNAPFIIPQQTVSMLQNQVVYVEERATQSTIASTPQPQNYIMEFPFNQVQNCTFMPYVTQQEQLQQNYVPQLNYSNSEVQNFQNLQFHEQNQPLCEETMQQPVAVDCNSSQGEQLVDASQSLTPNSSGFSDSTCTTPAHRSIVSPSPEQMASGASNNNALVDILRKAAEQMLEMSKKMSDSSEGEAPKKTRFAHTRKVAARKAEKLKSKRKLSVSGQTSVPSSPQPRIHLNIATLKPNFQFSVPVAAPGPVSAPVPVNGQNNCSPQLSILPNISNTSEILNIADPGPCEEESDEDDSPLLVLHKQKEKFGDMEREAPKDDPYLLYEITSEDGFSVRSHDLREAWKRVYEELQDARVASHMKQLTISPEDINGLRLMGLDNSALMYLLEQLPGAENCPDYDFIFHPPTKKPSKILENPTGCARSEPFLGRQEYDMFSFLSSEHRVRPVFVPPEDDDDVVHKSSRRGTNLDLPLAMRFMNLKTISREAVGVYRSSIHGRGLFCKRNIDAGELVIEYAGEVVRSFLTDKRERIYQSKGIGCYMFRIDDEEVVDATMHGNAARFINHSCEPNCFSKVITVDGKKHILIFALRRILRGEELTYDYKFPFEEEKIPCHCNSRRCRKYLN